MRTPAQCGRWRRGRELAGALLLLAPLLLAAPGRAGAMTPAVSTEVTHFSASVLVLAVQLDGHVLSDSLAAYQDGDDLLLPLGELARLLSLAITVDAEGGSAHGFLLREDVPFALNLAQGRLDVGGKVTQVDLARVRLIDGDIHVAISLLTRWLPVDLVLDLSALRLRVAPRTSLPIQARLARERAARALGAGRRGTAGGDDDDGDPAPLPLQPSPLALLALPFVDLTLGSDARLARSGATKASLGYTLHAAGDLLGMEGAIYLSGGRHGAHRISLARNDPDAGLLGPLRARTLQFGNISLPSLAEVAGARAQGTGWLVSNRPQDQAASFDRHALRGDLLPGWDVTLYYNDALVGYQAHRDDGRYAFDDLPLALGANVFRLVFNGPQGQVRVEQQSFLLSQSQLAPGALQYTVAQQQPHTGGLRSLVRADLGLTRAVSASAGWLRSATAAQDTPRSFTMLGLRGHALGAIASAQVTARQGGGWLAQLDLKTRLLGQSLEFSRTHRHPAFASDLVDAGPAALRHRSSLRLTGGWRMDGLPLLSVAATASHDLLVSGAVNDTAGLRLSTLLGGTAVTNSLRWQRSAGATGADGSLQLSRRMQDTSVSLQADYALQPARRWLALAASAARNLSEGFRVSVGLHHSPGTADTLLSGALNKRFDGYAVAVNGSVSRRGELAVGLQFFLALGHDPRHGRWFLDAQPLAHSGAVSARAFVDRNLDGRRDPDEELIANAGFVINGGGRHHRRTDAEGTVFIGRLQSGQSTHIALDANTLDDPQWRPLTPGVRVVPRPGVVDQIDFPVVSTSDLEGTVHLHEHGTRRAIGAVRLELVDASGKVVASTRSAADGFYFFHQVMPGCLTLRVSPEQVARLGLSGLISRAVQVPADGDLISGLDLELQRAPR